jgi:hypothetical protein
MKRFLPLVGVVALLTVGAASCSDKVDRDGTRDNLVEQVEAVGGTVDKDCVDDILDDYSDSELKTFDEELQKDTTDNADAEAFVEKVLTCVTVGE